MNADLCAGDEQAECRRASGSAAGHGPLRNQPQEQAGRIHAGAARPGQGGRQGSSPGPAALGFRHSGCQDPRLDRGGAGASNRGADGGLGARTGLLGCLRSGLPEPVR